jgi:adenine-specific DNA-methyltransferase
VPLLADVIGALAPGGVVLDLFSGTSRVGHELKRRGFRVLANDHNAYAATLARCYVAADADRWRTEAATLIAELDAVAGRPGWFTETYCVASRFFRPENGARIDAIRDRIAALCLDPELEAIALVSLMEAADRVDSTTGVQMAYLKAWAARAASPLQLRVPEVLAGPGSAFELDALDAAARLEGDVAYLDPPYNQHKYLGNYHIWETLVRWDRPDVYGIAKKRVDCQERTSAFNSRRQAADAMRRLVATVRARHLVVSFSDEGYFSRDELEAILRTRGDVVVLSRDYARYVGARIGIYSPQGKKVGAIGRLRNTEHVFVVSPDAAVLAAIRDRGLAQVA